MKFRTKPQIALQLIDRALANGVRVAVWTFDEFYGRDGKFLDGLEQRRQMTIEQVRSATKTWLSAADLKPAARRKRHEKDNKKRRCHQRRNLQAGKSHTKTKTARLIAMGIDPDRIKSRIVQRAA